MTKALKQTNTPVNLADLPPSPTQGFSISGINNDQGGYSVSRAGDVNADGIADIIIGAPTAGMSYVIYGKLGGLSNINLANLATDQGFSISGYGGSGSSVSGAGDVNGDGYDDIVIGAPDDNSEAGVSYVIYGKPGGLSNINLANLTSAQGFSISGSGYDNSGSSVSRAGDVNNDTIADIIIGAPGASVGSLLGAGISYVIYGKSGGLSNINLASLTSDQGFSISGINAYDRNGHVVSAAGDINGDHIADIIIGVPNASAGSLPFAGVSYVIYGKAGGLDNINLANLTQAQGFAINGANMSAYSGYTVSGAGDINGDGYDDIVIGNLNGGMSYVIYGQPGGLGNINLANLTSAQGFTINNSNYNTVWSVASAGDVNNDGIADVIMGGATLTATSSLGFSSVVYGKYVSPGNIGPGEITPAQGFTMSGVQWGDGTGTSVAGAGDVNGDGYDDIIIGAPRANSAAGVSYVIYGGNTVGCSTSSFTVDINLNVSLDFSNRMVKAVWKS